MSRRRGEPTTPIDQYNAAARAAAATVIDLYSTSFGLAARLLEPRVRHQVRSIYALVRIADEIVDGAAAGAGIDIRGQLDLLDGLEHDTERAIDCGYSTNLVVHAFALTARDVGIDATLTRPFFASMRRDLDPRPLSPAGLAEYIYGSAEVIGLMCLRSFLENSPRTAAEWLVLERGSQHLGAAFQKVNFLRDLGNDQALLGRSYFPGSDPLVMDESHKNALLDDIDEDLALAFRSLPLLPTGSRRAVTAAHRLFSELAMRLRATPAAELGRSRVRVPDAEKLGIAFSAALGVGSRRP